MTFGHEYKTKPEKVDITILEKNILLRYFRNFNISTINENSDKLDHHVTDTNLLCLPLNLNLVPFQTTHFLKTEGFIGSEKYFYTKSILTKRTKMG